METVEFKSKVKKGKILIPSNLSERFSENQEIQVAIAFKEAEEKEWDKMVAREFFKGYAEEDSIYDNL